MKASRRRKRGVGSWTQTNIVQGIYVPQGFENISFCKMGTSQFGENDNSRTDSRVLQEQMQWYEEGENLYLIEESVKKVRIKMNIHEAEDRI